MRRGDLVEFMHRDGSARSILRLLKEGRLFGVLIDQDTKVEGVFADFLGRPAWTPSSPMRIAMTYNLPVYVSWTARQPDGTHRLVVRELENRVDTGDFDADLVANLETVNRMICEGVRQYPEQWVWMHDRWKTKPGER